MKLRGVTTDLLLFMIADEKRDSKPYSILVRALPFPSISDDGVRTLCNELRASMISIGMVPVGLLQMASGIPFEQWEQTDLFL